VVGPCQTPLDGRSAEACTSRDRPLARIDDLPPVPDVGEEHEDDREVGAGQAKLDTVVEQALGCHQEVASERGAEAVPARAHARPRDTCAALRAGRGGLGGSGSPEPSKPSGPARDGVPVRRLRARGRPPHPPRRWSTMCGRSRCSRRRSETRTRRSSCRAAARRSPVAAMRSSTSRMCAPQCSAAASSRSTLKSYASPSSAASHSAIRCRQSGKASVDAPSWRSSRSWCMSSRVCSRLFLCARTSSTTEPRTATGRTQNAERPPQREPERAVEP
jgi:hypothetical protein